MNAALSQCRGDEHEESRGAITGQRQSLSLDGLEGEVEAKACDMVLEHPKSML